MKRIVFLFLGLVISIVSWGITQNGYVKQVNRPSQSGGVLSGVAIRVRGAHNAIESSEKGDFSILLPALQNGDAFSLNWVNKAGYELCDQNLIGRQIACSDIVPLEIVMVNSEQLLKEKERIAQVAIQNIEHIYEQRVTELEKMLKDNKIATEQYQSQLQQIEEKYEAFLPLIQSMSDYYARVDYDALDSTDMQVQNLIEQGHLLEAKRLILLKGSPQQRAEQIQQVEQWTKAQKQELTQDLYHLYSICLQRYENDSAAMYICARAEVDTNNVDFQLQAGQLMKDIQADYPSALNYFLRAERISMRQYGYYSGPMATTLLELGSTYKLTHRLTDAKDYYQRSLDVREKIRGKNSPAVAELLNNFAELVASEKNYNQALKYHERAYKIRLKYFSEDNPKTAESLMGLAGAYYRLGKYKTALEGWQKARTIYQNIPDTPQQRLAAIYNNIAGAYFQLGNQEEACRYFQIAYDIYVKVLGPMHPRTKNTKANLDYIQNHGSTNE